MKKIGRDLNFCGVYMITNLVNGHRYIGSSMNIAQRLWSHRSNLRHNTHCNQHLQNAWNKYGEDKFDYCILEKCTEDLRFNREQFYVDTLNPEYNICTEVVQNPPKTESTRAKHSETRKRLMSEGKIPITNNKPVYVYYKDGSFVGKWESIRKAAGSLGISYSSACLIVQGHYKQAKGYTFFLEPQEGVLPFDKPKNHKPTNLRTYVIDDGVNKVEVFGREALADYFGTSVFSIAQYIGGKHKWKRKYMIY